MGILVNLFKDQLHQFKLNLWLSSVGARVCYNKGDASEILLSDPRVVSGEDRAKFLKKLGFKYYHTSVFAHSFGWFYLDRLLTYTELTKLGLSEETAIEIYNKQIDGNIGKVLGVALLGSKYFKSVAKPSINAIGLSFRHFIEDADTEEEKEILYSLIYTALDPDLDKVIGLNEFTKHKRKVCLVYSDTLFEGYVVFLIQDVSRVLTHQLVRHTKLNYSQRSQRYVREETGDLFVYPKDMKPSTKEVYRDFYDYSKMIYDILIDKHKVKKEDARFILPQATKTTIMVSGTIKDIKDFIYKRKIQQAQREIRDIAYEMEELLEEV